MSEPLQETRWYDGRIMSAGVWWWLTIGGRPANTLVCLHDERLDIHCNECAQRRADAPQNKRDVQPQR